MSSSLQPKVATNIFLSENQTADFEIQVKWAIANMGSTPKSAEILREIARSSQTFEIGMSSEKPRVEIFQDKVVIYVDMKDPTETLESKLIGQIVKIVGKLENPNSPLWGEFYQRNYPTIAFALNVTEPPRCAQRDFLFAYATGQLDTEDPNIKSYIQHAEYGPFPNRDRLFPLPELDAIVAARRAKHYDLALELVINYLEVFRSDQAKWRGGIGEKGLIHELRGEYQEAISNFELIIADCSQNNPADILVFSSACYEISKSYSELKNHKEAIASIEIAIESAREADMPNYPKDVKLLQMDIRRGRYYCRDGQTITGKAILNEALAQLERIYNDIPSLLSDPLGIIERQKIVQAEIGQAKKYLAEFPDLKTILS